MNWMVDVLMVVGAYLLGSIPSAVWIGKTFYGVDVREHGSKNAGSTNTIRVLGLAPGLVVFVMDMVKGFLAVNLVHLSYFLVPRTVDFVNLQLVLGISAVLGHIFPVFAQFRGGKGVATLFGLVMAIHPYPTLVCFGIFLLTLFVTKYVSLSSIVAGFTFPILVMFVFKTTIPSLIIFSMTVSILLLFTHQKNIERLVRRQENKATFLKRRRRHMIDE
ncbi:MAG TPA: glycerol-3-phosphate 1-O-acyltransferase PlsY [Bacteroidales bacterium]|nr:glycerol-3-phosphate 1-O-acyltransferase PlsY [Bacteroidales bacterium]